MRRSSLVLVLVLAAAVTGVVAATSAGPPSSPPAAAQPAAGQPADHWCNFILAGRNATADGSVLMGYNRGGRCVGPPAPPHLHRGDLP